MTSNLSLRTKWSNPVAPNPSLRAKRGNPVTLNPSLRTKRGNPMTPDPSLRAKRGNLVTSNPSLRTKQWFQRLCTERIGRIKRFKRFDDFLMQGLMMLRGKWTFQCKHWKFLGVYGQKNAGTQRNWGWMIFFVLESLVFEGKWSFGLNFRSVLGPKWTFPINFHPFFRHKWTFCLNFGVEMDTKSIFTLKNRRFCRQI